MIEFCFKLDDDLRRIVAASPDLWIEESVGRSGWHPPYFYPHVVRMSVTTEVDGIEHVDRYFHGTVTVDVEKTEHVEHSILWVVAYNGAERSCHPDAASAMRWLRENPA